MEEGECLARQTAHLFLVMSHLLKHRSLSFFTSLFFSFLSLYLLSVSRSISGSLAPGLMNTIHQWQDGARVINECFLVGRRPLKMQWMNASVCSTSTRTSDKGGNQVDRKIVITSLCSIDAFVAVMDLSLLFTRTCIALISLSVLLLKTATTALKIVAFTERKWCKAIINLVPSSEFKNV